MNWFEKHLNWSYFLGVYLFPSIISFILYLIFFPQLYSGLLSLVASGAGKSEIMAYILSIAMQFAVVFFIVGFVLLIFVCIITWWYLGRKARSKWLLLLLFVPFGFIVLLFLENKAIGYGGDFAGEAVTDRRPDTGPFGAPDDRQLKELDYTPNKNVLDIVDKPDTKDTGVTKDVSDIGDVGAPRAASEEAPAPEKVTERAVSTERLKLPILLDDAGAVIRCFYHPGADAVNLCSRCQQYVCSECNYVTGTHPICRNCWAKRAEVPIAPPAPKQVSPASGKPEKQKGLESIKPEKQKIAETGKSGKLDAEKNEWQPEFMALYEQASPIINVVTRRSADGMPASPLDLMEGLKLRPMLERSKKLSKPKDKELREAKSEFEQVLSSCIKIADAAADFVSGGGQALLGGPDFARIVQGIETANGLMQKLSSRLASFSNPQE
jgi:hypothetical protein